MQRRRGAARGGGQALGRGAQLAHHQPHGVRPASLAGQGCSAVEDTTHEQEVEPRARSTEQARALGTIVHYGGLADWVKIASAHVACGRVRDWGYKILLTGRDSELPRRPPRARPRPRAEVRSRRRPARRARSRGGPRRAAQACSRPAALPLARFGSRAAQSIGPVVCICVLHTTSPSPPPFPADDRSMRHATRALGKVCASTSPPARIPGVVELIPAGGSMGRLVCRATAKPCLSPATQPSAGSAASQPPCSSLPCTRQCPRPHVSSRRLTPPHAASHRHAPSLSLSLSTLEAPSGYPWVSALNSKR